MVRPVAALLALAAVLTLAACGGENGPPDQRVGSGLDGSGQERLLADPGFASAVDDIGVSPRTRPEARLGRAIGRRMRALLVDTGRMAPGAFLPGAYRRELVRRGRLSEAAFRRRYGQGPREMCDRIGVLAGQLEWRLDEGADPAPELARGVLDGFGRGRFEVRAANRISAVTDQLNDRLPDEDGVDCVQRFRSSYLFASSLYRRN